MTLDPRGARILVVDDEPDLRTLYELSLLREGYRVDVADTLAQAQALLEAQTFDVLITDMRLPDGLGLSLIQRLRSQQRPERCVVITAYGSAENAVDSLKAGAFDYLTKPVDLRQFRSVVAAAVQASAASMQERPPGDPVPTHDPGRSDPLKASLVGESEVMRQVRERIAKVARSMAPVLVCGESGTGKELAARALHTQSHRAGGPFVPVNCSAIPDTLLESEFFGVRKGAYTGATHDRPGFFQSAHGGTLFLDEIGDLPLAMQSKLLRAIQERCIRPVGSTAEEPVDVRIVSATHKNLADEVQAGRFRQDLYYRINVIEIEMPALRERQEDLPGLCAALLQRICTDAGLPTPQLDAQGLAWLRRQALRGNVRELENLLHRAVALHDGQAMLSLGSHATPRSDDLENTATEIQGIPAAPAHAEPAQHPGLHPTPHPTPAEDPPLPEDLQSHLDQQERRILIQALQACGYNRTAAAARLGLSLRQMRYRIARLQIELPQDHEQP